MNSARLSFALAGVIALLYWVALYGQGEPYDLDRYVFYLPTTRAVLDAGGVPLWASGMWAGFPLHAEGQVHFFSPLRAVAALSGDPLSALALETLLVLVCAALAGAWAAQQLGLGPAAAVTAGVVWALGGSALTWQEAPHILTAFLPLPAVFLCGVRARWGLLTGWFTLSILSGYPYAVLMNGVVALLGTLLVPGEEPRGRRITWLSLAVGVASLVSAIQLLPTLELITQSDRWGGMADTARQQATYGLSDLRFLVWPLTSPEVRYSTQGGVLTYFGLLALSLAIFGARLTWGKRTTRVLVGIVLGSLAGALLLSSPVGELVGKLPGASMIRGPSKLIYLTSFALALLTAEGVEAVAARKGVWAWVLLALIALDLGSFGLRRADPVPRDELRARPAVLEHVPAGSRIRVLGTQAVWASEIPEGARGFLRDAQPMDANSGLLFGVEHLDGYSALRTRRNLDYSLAVNLQRLRKGATPYLVLAPNQRGPAALKRLAAGSRWVLFQVPKPLPKAYLCPEAVAARSHHEALRGVDRLRDGVAVLEGPQAAKIAGPLAPGPTPASSPGEVEVLSWEGGAIDLRAELTRPAILVVADSYYPGWTATVNGTDAPLLLANANWKGVALPAGSHTVVLRYRPWSWTWGCVLSLLGVVAAAGWGWRSRQIPPVSLGEDPDRA